MARQAFLALSLFVGYIPRNSVPSLYRPKTVSFGLPLTPIPDSLDGAKTAQTLRMGRMDLKVSPLNRSSVMRWTSAKNFLRSDFVYPSPLK